MGNITGAGGWHGTFYVVYLLLRILYKAGNWALRTGSWFLSSGLWISLFYFVVPLAANPHNLPRFMDCLSSEVQQQGF